MSVDLPPVHSEVVTEPVQASWPRRLTPARLLVLVTFLVFIGEALVMLFIGLLPPMPWWRVALLDASTLLIVLSPAYFLLYLPLKSYHAAHQRHDLEIASLSRQTIRTIEEEKRRLATDLHDECGQVLTALQLGIQTLKISLQRQESSLAGQCERLEKLTGHLVVQVRQITTSLRPAILESGGIAETLRWHTDQVGRDWPELKIDLAVFECNERLSPETEIVLFRICQESLNNIVKHARADQASIRLTCGAECELIIKDNGVGFLPEQATAGLGLIGMRERVIMFKGRFHVHSAPGEGTVIHVAVPAFPKEKSCPPSAS